jgi:ribosomal subunit interface protein
MKLQLQITTRDIPHSEALENHIREKAEKLDIFYPNIMGCRVVVEVPHKHKHQGRTFNVRLDITVPGKELVVNHEHEDVYAAARIAFDAAKRQLEDYGRRQRGDVKAHTPVLRGKVVRLIAEEGYGFIQTHEGEELYFNRDNLAEDNFEKLEEGSEVQFLEDIGGEGVQAKRVSTGKHHVTEGEAESE